MGPFQERNGVGWVFSVGPRGLPLMVAPVPLCPQQEQEYYLVKWRGYPDSESTWEPRQNLKCVRILKQFHKDLERELLRRHHRSKPPRHLDPNLSNYLVQKAKQRRALQRWEQELNAKRSHLGRITVENEVDLDGPPRAFVYINEYRVGEGITLNQVAVGCECQDCLWAPTGGCCPGASLHKFAYNDQGQVRLRAGQPIYECNSRCRCGYDCPNRVVQKGIRYDLCIFRTDDGRGWGVRTLEKIRKNSFVMEYVGEVRWDWVCVQLFPLCSRNSPAFLVRKAWGLV
jgi:histone-lysine N-methyltransferase SUV39H